VVTLAEPLVVKETEQLCARLRRELGTVPALVVVNRVVQPDPDGAWEAVTALAEQDPEMAGDANELMDILRARGDQADDTAYALGLARSVEARHVVPLPDAARDPLASEVVQWLRAEVPT
jgi:hypothetical protein